MSNRYRSQPNVDETLFGNGPNGTGRNTKRSQTCLPVISSTVISLSELQRIKRESTIKTPIEEAQEKAWLLEQKEEREKKSKARKDRMKELEKKSEAMAKKSDIEVANIARNEAIRAMASQKIDENSDMVKLLTSLAARASAFTIRDAQLVEKEDRERKEDEYTRAMDMEMEIDRLRDLQRREKEESEKRAKRIEDRKVITEQMEYRKRMKLLAGEAREQENMAMRELAKKYSADDKEAARIRAIEIEKSRKEVLLANEESLRRKREARELEKKEVQDILIYQQLKDAEMLKREQDEAAIENLKKERQAKLLAQQEKAQNNQGKLDEIRARRAQEERERRARKKEKEEFMKRKADLAELTVARAGQARARKEREDAEKQFLEQEYADCLAFSQKQSMREEAEKNERTRKNEDHRVKLHAQIAERESGRKRGISDKYSLGSSNKQDAIKEEARLSVIRDKMIQDMEAKGINPKYLGEMKNVDIRKMLNR